MFSNIIPDFFMISWIYVEIHELFLEIIEGRWTIECKHR